MSVANVGNSSATLNVGQCDTTHVEKTDLHYLGGVIDSEGSIYISTEASSDHRCGFRLKPRFGLTMKTRNGSDGTIELFEEFLNGVGCSYKLVQQSVDMSPVADGDDAYGWRLQLTSKSNVLPFLEEIKPYLRLKRHDAELVLSAPWDSWYRDREAFEELVDVRAEIRSMSADRDTKYPAEKLKAEVSL